MVLRTDGAPREPDPLSASRAQAHGVKITDAWRSILLIPSSAQRVKLASAAKELGGIAAGSSMSVRRGWIFPATFRVDTAGGRIAFSAERRGLGANAVALWAELDSFRAEVATATGGRDRPLGGLGQPDPYRPQRSLTIQGRPYEFGMTLTDLLPRHQKSEEFRDSPTGNAVEKVVAYEKERRRAFWAQMGFVGSLFLLALMAATWAAPLNWWSVGFGWGVLAASVSVYGVALLRKQLRKVAALAMAATVAIALFGLVYATLLAAHPLAPEHVWGARLGGAFLLSAGVGATAGTFDQPLRESIRVAIHIQLLLFVGGTAGTAAWAAWRAIRGISEVNDELGNARDQIAGVNNDVDRVASQVQGLQVDVSAAATQLQHSVNVTVDGLYGRFSEISQRLESIEELLRGLVPPERPR